MLTILFSFRHQEQTMTIDVTCMLIYIYICTSFTGYIDVWILILNVLQLNR